MGKKKQEKTVLYTVPTTNYVPTRMNRPTCHAISTKDHRVPVPRPGYPIGRLLALQQYDGVDGLVNNLFKGQYDESFGDVDPATDIRHDPHEFQDSVIRSGYDKVFNQRQNE